VVASFIWNRVIAVHRPQPAITAGDGGYAGLEATTETVIASGIPASIQTASRGGTGFGIGHVPSDAGRVQYRIHIPFWAQAAIPINTRDIVVDDLGRRFQVSAPQPDSLGPLLLGELLTA
jgi:hypothetical protein